MNLEYIDVPDDFRVEISNTLQSFLYSNSEEIAFKDLDNVKRKYIHQYCVEIGLESKSYGSKNEKVLYVFRKNKKVKRFNFDYTFSQQQRMNLSNLTQRLPREFCQPIQSTPQLSDRKKGFILSNSNPKNIQYINERINLPIFQFKSDILDIIRNNDVIFISGNTGCGKSTQVPQYLLEDDCNAHIIVAEPRRIICMALAERVAFERGEKLNENVSYSIRFDSSHKSTSIEFMTIGFLLKRLSTNTFHGITHLIIDEVHERSVYVDMLLYYSKYIRGNFQVKLILMSATASASLFESYFPGLVQFSISGQNFDVKSVFMEEISDILCQFNSQKIYLSTCRKCKMTFPDWKHFGYHAILCGASVSNDFKDDENFNHIEHIFPNLTQLYTSKFESMDIPMEAQIDYTILFDLISYVIYGNSSTLGILVFLPGWNEIKTIQERLLSLKRSDVEILLLHSQLNFEDEKHLFRPRNNIRIILSTNIAESSLTIPSVDVVIDCGLNKVKYYDTLTNISFLRTEWISKANAIQRKGRVGRDRAGLCYHLYTEYRYNNFIDIPIPQIKNISLYELILSIKSLNLSDELIKDQLSNFIDPPNNINIENGLNLLVQIGALSRSEEITYIGSQIININMDPLLAKAILFSKIFQCYEPVAIICCILSAGSPFQLSQNQEDRNIISQIKSHFYDGFGGDFFTFLNIYDYFFSLPNFKLRKDFCSNSRLCYEQFIMANTMYSELSNQVLNNTNPKYVNQNANNRDLVLFCLYSGLETFLLVREGGKYFYNSHKIKTNFCESDFQIFYDAMKFNYQIRVQISSPINISFLLFVSEVEFNHSTNEVTIHKDVTIKLAPDDFSLLISFRDCIQTYINRSCSTGDFRPTSNERSIISSLAHFMTSPDNHNNNGDNYSSHHNIQNIYTNYGPSQEYNGYSRQMWHDQRNNSHGQYIPSDQYLRDFQNYSRPQSNFNLHLFTQHKPPPKNHQYSIHNMSNNNQYYKPNYTQKFPSQSPIYINSIGNSNYNNNNNMNNNYKMNPGINDANLDNNNMNPNNNLLHYGSGGNPDMNIVNTNINAFPYNGDQSDYISYNSILNQGYSSYMDISQLPNMVPQAPPNYINFPYDQSNTYRNVIPVPVPNSRYASNLYQPPRTHYKSGEKSQYNYRGGSHNVNDQLYFQSNPIQGQRQRQGQRSRGGGKGGWIAPDTNRKNV